jgi:uncharacterized protein
VEDLGSRLGEFLSTPARQAATLAETGHRPMPLPEGEWIHAQTWENLLFAHWRVPVDELRVHVPEELPLDTFDGSAWVGLTPFRIRGLRVRGLLPLPLVSSFLELNVRTYVELDGKAGIYFFSLDAESSLAVEAARRLYRLPYFRARMSADFVRDEVDFASERVEGRRAALHTRYRPHGEATPPAAGSFEHFLTERYCLFTMHEDRVHWAQIHHPPWPLQQAEVEITENTMPPPGIELSGDPLCHFSARQDVVLWALELFEP